MMLKSAMHNGLFLTALLLSGCAAVVEAPSGAARSENPVMVSQDRAGDLTAQYHVRAAELRQLAQRTKWEAQWFAGQFDARDEAADQRAQQARRLWTAAEEADQSARAYGRQVPHG